MTTDLWSGPNVKLGYARFHLNAMHESLQPPVIRDRRYHDPSTIVGGLWHLSFYPHLDAFLSVTRSIPEIIQCCFGVDTLAKVRKNKAPKTVMQKWFANQPSEERRRRQKFEAQFKQAYDSFRKLSLSHMRNITLHRTGLAPVKVEVSDRFGVTHVGGPTTPIPLV